MQGQRKVQRKKRQQEGKVMGDEQYKLVLELLQEIRSDVKGIISRSHLRQLGCIDTFATKKSVRYSILGVVTFFTTLMLLSTYHPDALIDVVKGFRGFFK
jgi:hypothetical protein